MLQMAKRTLEQEWRERKPVLEAGGAGRGGLTTTAKAPGAGPRAGDRAEPAQTPLLRKWGAGKMGAGSEPEDRRGRFLTDVGSEKGRKWPRQLLNIWNHRITQRPQGCWVGGGVVHAQALFLPPCRRGSASPHTVHPLSGSSPGWGQEPCSWSDGG